MKKNIVAALVLVVTVGGCQSGPSLDTKNTEWQISVDKAIPKGTSIEDARRWGAAIGIELHDARGNRPSENERQLWAIVERVPVRGLDSFVCDEWSITLTIRLNERGMSEQNEIGQIGHCL